MTKKMQFLLVLLVTVLFISPVKANALTIDNYESNFTNNIYILIDPDVAVNSRNNSTVQGAECETGILGDPSDENSVAWLLQHVLDFIKIVGPIIVIVLSSVEFAKVVIKNDDESMGKAKKRLITRLILVLLLFLIPQLVELLLDIFAFSSGGTCGIH